MFRAETFSGVVGTVLSSAAALGRKRKSLCVHTTRIHCNASAHRCFVVAQDMRRSQFLGLDWTFVKLYRILALLSAR